MISTYLHYTLWNVKKKIIISASTTIDNKEGQGLGAKQSGSKRLEIYLLIGNPNISRRLLPDCLAPSGTATMSFFVVDSRRSRNDECWRWTICMPWLDGYLHASLYTIASTTQERLALKSEGDRKCRVFKVSNIILTPYKIWRSQQS